VGTWVTRFWTLLCAFS